MKVPPVLIVGAGPSGLSLALWLTHAGIGVRIIDAAPCAGTTSRALVVHARTLEFYRQLGIDKVVVGKGIPMQYTNIWVGGKLKASVPFGEAGRGLSPYPYILMLAQDVHEGVLVAELEKVGVNVDRNTKLISFREEGDGVMALIEHKDGRQENFEASYLAGCDGAHSVVRRQLGVGFPGGTYDNVFYVADLTISGPIENRQFNLALDEADILLVFPMLGEGRVRLIGSVQQAVGDAKKIEWEDVTKGVMDRLNITVEKVHWFSTYRVHHRVASSFRQGRAFLVGDAGHIHSPVGGQGMNTGIGDAMNLGWKIAAVMKARCPEGILDTYQQERMAFAQQLVSTTDRAFTFASKRSRVASWVRTRIVPVVLRIAFRFAFVRRLAFRGASQTQIAYTNSALSGGKAGGVRGGDRLPWAGDNFDDLCSLDWAVHVYGAGTAKGGGNDLDAVCKKFGVAVKYFLFDAAVRKTGIPENAIFVVRPDGHVALAMPDFDAAKLEAFFGRWLCVAEEK